MSRELGYSYAVFFTSLIVELSSKAAPHARSQIHTHTSLKLVAFLV